MKNIIRKIIKIRRHYLKAVIFERKILINIFWLCIERFTGILTGFITYALLARHLGTELYGSLSYAIAIVGILQPVSNLGLNTLVIRELSCNTENKNEILGTTSVLNLVGGLITLFTSLLLAQVLKNRDPYLAFIIGILASSNILNILQSPTELWFQSQLESKYILYSNNSASISYLCMTLALTMLGAKNLIIFALSKTISSWIKTLILLFNYVHQKQSLKLWKVSIDKGKILLKESHPLILSSLAILLYVKIDQIMIGQLIGSSSVATYSAAAQISESMYFIPVILLNSFAPSIYKAKERFDEISYTKKIKSLLLLLSITSILTSIFFYIISDKIILLTFGIQYTDSIKILQIHIWASIFVFSGTGASCWFVAEKLSHMTLYRTLCGAISNVILNLYLIPRYAGIGAATATVISYAIGSMLANFIHPKTRSLFWIQLNALFLNFKYCK